jgi:hypothetical protein
MQVDFVRWERGKYRPLVVSVSVLCFKLIVDSS